MITIINDGPDLAQTNYWESEHASVGLCYLSGNAGLWRLLVPETAISILDDILTGQRAVIEESIHAPRQAVDVVFEDGTDMPFSIAIDKRQIDRALQPSECRLTVWVEGRGKVVDLPCTVRV